MLDLTGGGAAGIANLGTGSGLFSAKPTLRNGVLAFGDAMTIAGFGMPEGALVREAAEEAPEIGSAAVAMQDAAEAGPAATTEAGTHTVYVSYNEAGEVQYVGMTNDFDRRQGEHAIDIIPLLEGLTREEARGTEQVLIERYGLGKNGGTLLNKINSISARNPPYESLTSKGSAILSSKGL